MSAVSSYRYVNRGDSFYLWIENNEDRYNQTASLVTFFNILDSLRKLGQI